MSNSELRDELSKERSELAEALHEAAEQCNFPLDAEMFGVLVWWSYIRDNTDGPTETELRYTTGVNAIDAHLAQHYMDLMEEGE